jgi:hypothetical protein
MVVKKVRSLAGKLESDDAFSKEMESSKRDLKMLDGILADIADWKKHKRESHDELHGLELKILLLRKAYTDPRSHIAEQIKNLANASARDFPEPTIDYLYFLWHYLLCCSFFMINKGNACCKTFPPTPDQFLNFLKTRTANERPDPIYWITKKVYQFKRRYQTFQKRFFREARNSFRGVPLEYEASFADLSDYCRAILYLIENFAKQELAETPSQGRAIPGGKEDRGQKGAEAKDKYSATTKNSRSLKADRGVQKAKIRPTDIKKAIDRWARDLVVRSRELIAYWSARFPHEIREIGRIEASKQKKARKKAIWKQSVLNSYHSNDKIQRNMKPHRMAREIRKDLEKQKKENRLNVRGLDKVPSLTTVKRYLKEENLI